VFDYKRSIQQSAFSPRAAVAILKKILGTQTKPQKTPTTDDGDLTDLQ